MSNLKFTVKWGKEVMSLELPPTTTVGQLRQTLQQRTNVPPTMQKLMFKGQMKDDTKTLAEVGVKDGAKLMMIGSTVQVDPFCSSLDHAPPPAPLALPLVERRSSSSNHQMLSVNHQVLFRPCNLCNNGAQALDACP